ncbi:hypothetical protein C8R44DRAFT_821460 [Mycena epipterygia]|nr:hypothetical protein C8R44DRAFT_821460 [Mycena epipterygia]
MRRRAVVSWVPVHRGQTLLSPTFGPHWPCYAAGANVAEMGHRRLVPLSFTTPQWTTIRAALPDFTSCPLPVHLDARQRTQHATLPFLAAHAASIASPRTAPLSAVYRPHRSRHAPAVLRGTLLRPPASAARPIALPHRQRPLIASSCAWPLRLKEWACAWQRRMR